MSEFLSSLIHRFSVLAAKMSAPDATLEENQKVISGNWE